MAIRFSLGCQATCRAFLVNSIVSGLMSSFFGSFLLLPSFILFVNEVFVFDVFCAYLEASMQTSFLPFFVVNVEIVVVRPCQKLCSVPVHCTLELIENAIIFVQVTKLRT